jgi:FKBP-type peptidyl-prolyl cis-trans isomerase
MAKQEYIEANRKWLEEKAKKEGVKALPRGIYYKVLKQGDPTSAQPGKRSIVTVHYTGWTINGKKFDSSRGVTPIAMRLSDLIDGWIIAMQHMHVGDQCKLYIPAEMGYGKWFQPGIPGGSTLIFEVELLGVA